MGASLGPFGRLEPMPTSYFLLEMNKLIPVLVKNFDIEFMSKGGAVDSRKSLAGRNRWFVKPEYLYAKITKRV